MAAKLKELLEPEAKERKAAGQKSGGRGKRKNSGANLPQSINGEDRGPRARDQAAALLNVSGRSVEVTHVCGVRATTCRKDFTPSEIYELGQALEALEKPKAKERQAAAGPGEGKGKKSGSGNFPEPVDRGDVRDKVAAALGTSGQRQTSGRRPESDLLKILQKVQKQLLVIRLRRR